MHVIDNIIPLSYQNEIEDVLLSNYFPWYFTPDVTWRQYHTDGINTPANVHMFRNNKNTVSPFYQLVSPIVHFATTSINFHFSDVIQCRSFLQYPLNVNFLANEVDDLHIDLPIDHLVVLYYVTDADGETIIVNKVKEDDPEEINCNYKDYEILNAIQPKKGRVVIFDGKYYHTVKQPTKNIRCSINFDVLGYE